MLTSGPPRDDALLAAEAGRRCIRNRLGWLAGACVVVLTTAVIVVLLVRTTLRGDQWGLPAAVALIAGLARFSQWMLSRESRRGDSNP